MINIKATISCDFKDCEEKLELDLGESMHLLWETIQKHQWATVAVSNRHVAQLCPKHCTMVGVPKE